MTCFILWLFGRPKENEMVYDQLEKAIHLIWDCRIPSPRVTISSPISHIYHICTYVYICFFYSYVWCMHVLVRYINCLFWQCVAIDAVVECDLVSTLGVSVFPELIFTKTGKILHREKGTNNMFQVLYDDVFDLVKLFHVLPFTPCIKTITIPFFYVHMKIIYRKVPILE